MKWDWISVVTNLHLSRPLQRLSISYDNSFPEYQKPRLGLLLFFAMSNYAPLSRTYRFRIIVDCDIAGEQDTSVFLEDDIVDEYRNPRFNQDRH